MNQQRVLARDYESMWRLAFVNKATRRIIHLNQSNRHDQCRLPPLPPNDRSGYFEDTLKVDMQLGPST
jgi:hypothetical protein